MLLQCGADVNAQNESRSTPLLVASIPYNFNNDLVRLLLDYGGHLDQPNRNDDRPLTLINRNPSNIIPLVNYMSLKCLASTVINKYRIPYRNLIPKTLVEFVKKHES